jgi:hypothetical protein
MSDWNKAVIEEFRANGGKVSGGFERSLLLLTTRGARTGAEHTTPLAFLEDGDRYVVTASAAGAPRNPAWYHNVRANPTVTVEIGTVEMGTVEMGTVEMGTATFEADAAIPDRATRDELWSRVVEAMPGFGDYQKKTDRVIPVVVLTRR